MNKIFLVAKREYLSRVLKLSFWLSTLFFPVFIIVVGLISGLSSSAAEDLGVLKLDELEQPLLIQDESNFVNQGLQLPELVQFVEDKEEAIAKVKAEEADAFIYYPTGLFEGNPIEVYTIDQGLFGNDKYNDFANQLVIQSAQAEIDDPEVIAALNSYFPASVTAYRDGEPVSSGFEQMIFPIISMILYLMLVITGSGYMLQSVSEEKENRMIEVVLAAISSRELIWGKILGLIAVVFTQLFGLIALSVIPFVVFNFDLPIDISTLQISGWQILLSLFYIFVGFATLSGVMVGLASAMPSYKEAQSFSGVFYIMAVFPLYFVTLIIAEPSGTIATALSYVPLTSPLVLLARNAFGALGNLEIALSVVVNIVYLLLSFYSAFALFELGSLQYSQKLSPKQILQKILRRG